MITYIVLGSSPLAPVAYATARARWPEAPVITTNRGLAIEPNPDFFFLSDSRACDLWAEDGRRAAARNKRTKCVTLRRDAQAMKTRRVENFDLVVREGFPFEPFQMSGLWCVEFAVRVGCAREVVICGCDGYRKQLGVTDYFPGAFRIVANEGLGKDLTSKCVEPLSNRLALKYPEVSFILLGGPCYEVPQENWTVLSLSR